MRLRGEIGLRKRRLRFGNAHCGLHATRMMNPARANVVPRARAPFLLLKKHPKKTVFGSFAAVFAAHQYSEFRARALARARFYDAASEELAENFTAAKSLRKKSLSQRNFSLLDLFDLEFLSELFRHVVRSCGLALLFLPAVVKLVPVALAAATNEEGAPALENAIDAWLATFAGCVQRSGAILIKVAQYVSHRRDLVGDKVADRFYYLREACPAHSWKETQEILRDDLGVEVDGLSKNRALEGRVEDDEPDGRRKISAPDILRGDDPGRKASSPRPSTSPSRKFFFTDFDPVPVASGSIAQVYRAEIEIVDSDAAGDGRSTTLARTTSSRRLPVAVKVRHPGVESEIATDLSLLHGTLSFLSNAFSPLQWMQLPVTIDEFRKVLLDQTDMRFELRHLKRFRECFGEQFATFPEPILATERVLVESFVEDAKPISYFIEHPQSFNEELARLGMQVINKMIWTHNFIHADCHSGNLFFRVRDRREVLKGERKDLRRENQEIVLRRKKSMRAAEGRESESGGQSLTHDIREYANNCGRILQSAVETASMGVTDLFFDAAQAVLEFSVRRGDEGLARFRSSTAPPPAAATYFSSGKQERQLTEGFRSRSTHTSESHQLDEVGRPTVHSLAPLIESPEKSSMRFFRKREHRHLEIEMVLFDVGMVTVLTEQDRRRFMKLVKAIVTRDTEGCAEMLQGLCSYNESAAAPEVAGGRAGGSTGVVRAGTASASASGSGSDHGERQRKMEACARDMRVFFTELNRLPLHKVNVGGALRETLNIIGNHRLKIEGHFATLLSSLIILEGMAKELDPTINIMGSTVPFLTNVAVEAFMEG